MRFRPCRFFPAAKSLGFHFRNFFLLLAFGVASQSLPATARETVRVAAAANLVHVIEALHAAHRDTEPQVTLMVATGASGSFVAQIRHGAPYDVFLSADLDYPRALVHTGDADPASFTRFASGRLVLWTTQPDFAAEFPSDDDVPADDAIRRLLRSPRLAKLAIANADTAPYGRAARQVLKHLGLFVETESRLVVGENITQTAQFVETGNATAGFVALSLVLSPKLQHRGRWIEVPLAWHDPLDHAAILTTRGVSNPAAQRYLEFLQSPAARAILRRHGYTIPE